MIERLTQGPPSAMNMLEIHLTYLFGPTPEVSLSDRGWFIPADIFAQEDSVGVARINYQHNLMLVLCVRIWSR